MHCNCAIERVKQTAQIGLELIISSNLKNNNISSSWKRMLSVVFVVSVMMLANARWHEHYRRLWSLIMQLRLDHVPAMDSQDWLTIKYTWQGLCDQWSSKWQLLKYIYVSSASWGEKMFPHLHESSWNDQGERMRETPVTGTRQFGHISRTWLHA